MNFVAALDELKQGKYIKREGWKREEGYLAFMPGMLHVWKIIPHPNPNAGNHIFNMDEMLANDWLVKEKGIEINGDDKQPVLPG